MKNNILIAILVLITLNSCKTAFKTGQTPDDVYYSPAIETIEKRTVQNNTYYNDDERYLRMKVRNNSRWRMIDDYTYWNTPFIHYGYTYNTWYNPNVYNAFWFNQFNNNWGFTNGYTYFPFNPTFIVKNQIKTAQTNRPTFGGYKNNRYNNNNSSNTTKKIYTPRTNNNNNSGSTYTNSTPQRTYTPATSSGSSSSGSSSSSGGVSRPARRN